MGEDGEQVDKYQEKNCQEGESVAKKLLCKKFVAKD